MDGDAIVDRVQGEARLSYREQQLLDYLASHAGRFVPSSELRDALFGGIASASAPMELVMRIRRKLGPAVIESAVGFGYRISNARACGLARRCPRCGRGLVDYGADGWVCFGCGAQGERASPEPPVDLEVGRAPGPGMRSGAPWTEDERRFVMAHLEDLSLEQIGAALDRSESAVRGMLDGLGVRKRYVRAVVR